MNASRLIQLVCLPFSKNGEVRDTGVLQETPGHNLHNPADIQKEEGLEETVSSEADDETFTCDPVLDMYHEWIAGA